MSLISSFRSSCSPPPPPSSFLYQPLTLPLSSLPPSLPPARSSPSHLLSAFILKHPTKPIAYASAECIKSDGTVSTLKVAEDGTLTTLSTHGAGGKSTCYLTLMPGGKHLLVVNYWDAKLALLPLDAEGVISGDATQVVMQPGAEYVDKVGMIALSLYIDQLIYAFGCCVLLVCFIPFSFPHFISLSLSLLSLIDSSSHAQTPLALSRILTHSHSQSHNHESQSQSQSHPHNHPHTLIIMITPSLPLRPPFLLDKPRSG